MPTKKKFEYVLLAKGIQRKARIAGKVYDVKWDALYPSDKKYVLAIDEEDASRQIQDRIKGSGKWQGFSFIREVGEKPNGGR